MSKLGFIAWLRKRSLFVTMRDVQPCACRDVNCRGWRIVR